MKLIIANWKMHPKNEAAALALVKMSDRDDVVICPPTLFIPAVSKKLKRADLGAQDISSEDDGAFTGQVSGKQLKSYKVKYVIVGHSERRRLGEGNDVVAKKVAAALSAGITPVLCIGETRDEHVTGRTKEIVERQLELGLSLIVRQVPAARVIIAYEPVWAISGGDSLAESDTPENAAMIISYIKERLRLVPVRATVIYGGSVHPSNLSSFLEQREIDGVLVGGSSVELGFKGMLKQATEY